MRQWAPKRKFVGISLMHDGAANAEPQYVAGKLAQHWQPVFSAKDVDQDLLQWWMARVQKPECAVQWTMSYEDFQEFICHLRDSAAGPDGLVHGAYRWSPLSETFVSLLPPSS